MTSVVKLLPTSFKTRDSRLSRLTCLYVVSQCFAGRAGVSPNTNDRTLLLARVHILVPDEAALNFIGRADHVDEKLQVRWAGRRGRGGAAAEVPAGARPGRARARAS